MNYINNKSRICNLEYKSRVDKPPYGYGSGLSTHQFNFRNDFVILAVMDWPTTPVENPIYFKTKNYLLGNFFSLMNYNVFLLCHHELLTLLLNLHVLPFCAQNSYFISQRPILSIKALAQMVKVKVTMRYSS